MTKAKALPGLSAIAGDYDLFFCDIWGVVHNGVRAHRDAVDALVRYRNQGGRVALVTNAPRPSDAVMKALERLGVAREAYDVIVSSGDVTRRLVETYAGKIVHRVGPDKDLGLFEGIQVEFGPADQASAVIVTDLEADHETPEHYSERMQQWLALGLPMVCANPDKVVEIDGQLTWCGGAIADLYAERGGQVVLAGKPFAPIYDEALRLVHEQGAPGIARDRILAIGDAIRTDAMGAADQDVDFLFITGSVHAAEMAAGDADSVVADLIAPSGANMIGYMQRLAW